MEFKNTLMWKEINETTDVFKNIVKNNENTMKKAVAAIKSANAYNFVCAARGTSDHALTYFKYLCEQYTPYTVSLAAPSIVTQYNGKVNFAHSVVIGCSQSGKAADCIEVLNRAKSQGACTLSITNDEESPMASAADFHLFCSAGPEKSVAATKTFSAQLFICAWLVAELADDKKFIDRLFNEHSEIAGIAEKTDKLTDSFANCLKDMKSGFVLSRGTTFPIALEGTLKLQETCYIQMKGYAGSDFYHGPMAMVNGSTPVIIYCAENQNADLRQNIEDDQKKSIDKMIELGAPVYVVTTNKNIAKAYDGKVKVAYIDNIDDDRIAMFAFALFAQMLACKISCAIGNNPDSPRALNKVTITK